MLNLSLHKELFMQAVFLSLSIKVSTPQFSTRLRMAVRLTSALNPELTIMGEAGPWGYTFVFPLTKSKTIPDRINITPNN